MVEQSHRNNKGQFIKGINYNKLFNIKCIAWNKGLKNSDTHFRIPEKDVNEYMGCLL
jgi:hypothetical protein